MARLLAVSAVCAALLLAGANAAAKRADVVTVSVVVDATKSDGSFTCGDWFDGADGYSANGQYVEVLSSFGLPGNISPAVACREVDEVVHKLEMMGQKPGTNLADDPRKATEGTAELRTFGIIERTSLYITFQYTVTDGMGTTPKQFFDLLDKNIRNGNFSTAVATAPVPLLRASVYQEVYNSGPGIGPGVAC